MATTSVGTNPAEARKNTERWHWHPELPIPVSNLFIWPVKPSKLILSLIKSWITFTPVIVWLGLAFAIWLWASPAVDTMKTLSLDWIGFIFVRNLVLMTLVAGGLHFYFYILRAQNDERRFDARDFKTSHNTFMFKDQVKDNMFWTLTSGVATWSVYEVLYLWLYANQYLPASGWSENPVWFVAMFVIIPLWSSMHFYWIHRLLHWRPLYQWVHALHHKNVTIGPWTGISMHPVEHMLYFSSVLLHFVLASHPVHMLFHLYLQALNPACSHCGYEGVVVKDRNRLPLGDFFHQLHHRYFSCNYGTAEMPWDVWFGSFHDGTAEATKAMREKQRVSYRSANRGEKL